MNYGLLSQLCMNDQKFNMAQISPRIEESHETISIGFVTPILYVTPFVDTKKKIAVNSKLKI